MRSEPDRLLLLATLFIAALPGFGVETIKAASMPVGQSVEVAQLAQNDEGDQTFNDIAMEVVDGMPVIVYADSDGIHETRWHGSEWTSELISQAQIGQLDMGLIDGRPAVAYCHEDGDWLRYAEHSEDGWTINEIEGTDYIKGGVGIRIVRPSDGPVEITEVYEGSPAEEAGLESGDEIISVDGNPGPKGQRWDAVTQLISGEPGTEVRLKIHRENSNMQGNLRFQVERANLPLDPVGCASEESTYSEESQYPVALDSISSRPAVGYRSGEDLVFGEQRKGSWATHRVELGGDHLGAGPDLVEHNQKPALLYSVFSGDRGEAERLLLAEGNRENSRWSWEERELDRTPSYGQMYAQPRLTSRNGDLLSYFGRIEPEYEAAPLFPHLAKVDTSGVSEVELPYEVDRGHGVAIPSASLMTGEFRPGGVVIACDWTFDTPTPYTCTWPREPQTVSLNLFTRLSGESAMQQRLPLPTPGSAEAGTGVHGLGSATVVNASFRDSLLNTFVWDGTLYTYLHPAVVSASRQSSRSRYTYRFNIETPSIQQPTDPEFSWDFDGNGQADVQTSDTEITHTFQSAGLKNGNLQVKLANGDTKVISFSLPVRDFGPSTLVESYDRVGVGNQLASSNGRPTLSYGVHADGLKLASKRMETWLKSSVQRVSTYLPRFQYYSSDLVATDHSQLNGEDWLLKATRDELELFRSNSGEWHREHLSSNDCVRSIPPLRRQVADLETRGNSAAVLTYRKLDGSPSLLFLHQSHRAEWKREVIASGFTSCDEAGEPDMELIDGNYAAAFRTAEGLHYAVRNGTDNWTVEKVSDHSPLDPQLIKYNGRPAIIFGSVKESERGRKSPGMKFRGGKSPGMKFAVRRSRGWDVRTVSDKGFVSDAAVVWSQPAICFNEDGELKLARRTKLGWQFRTLDARREGDCSIAQIGDNLGVSSFTDYTYDLVYWDIGREEW